MRVVERREQRARLGRRRAQATPIAPCATAGSISSVERTEVACAARPSRSRPASASSVASARPSSSFLSRVSTLPRKSMTSRSGRSRFTCAARRSDERADHRARRQLGKRGRLGADEGVAHVAARQHRGDDNASGSTVGRSFIECTARSTVAASSASSISLVNRPLPPKSRSGASLMRSPEVVMTAQARHRPRQGHAPRSAARAHGAPARARAGCRACRSEGAGCGQS